MKGHPFCRLGHSYPIELRYSHQGANIVKIEDLNPTLSILSHWHGQTLNYSTLGKELGVSYKAAQSRIRCLAETNLIWLLYPLPAEITASTYRARKSPKLYLSGSARYSGPLGEELRFRGRMIRTICAHEAARNPSSKFWYYGGYGKTHIELIVQTASKRIGFVFLQEPRPNRWCWSYCKRVLARDIVQGGFVLYPGRRIFFAARRLVILPSVEFLKSYRRWMNACLGSSRKLLLQLVREYNIVHAEVLP
jgi:hypothetical protein